MNTHTNGYKLFRKDRNSFGGGLCLYINENIPCRKLECPLLEDTETIGIEINLRKRKWLVIGLYKPPLAYGKLFLETISNQLIVESINKKNKLFNKYVKCKNVVRKNALFEEYKQHKNRLLQTTRLSKKTFFQNYFIKNSKNVKKIWDGIKQIINIKSKNFNQPSCLIEEERTITDPWFRPPPPKHLGGGGYSQNFP